MLSLFKKKNASHNTETATLSIDGMHCTSCSMNIDGELEDTPGVVSASTNYARATTKVVFDPQTVTPKKLMQVVEKLGYTATQN